MAVLNILALNCGSSSLKFGAYRAEGAELELISEGDRQEIGNQDYVAALDDALHTVERKGMAQFDAVGHRFVHGGPHLREHCLLDAAVEAKLTAAVDYAPLHMPAALAVLKAIKVKMPGLPQAVCLDTAFHRNMPDVSRNFALPERVRELGVERYGFHGLSLESILAQLRSAPGRLIVAHLGNGASITAIRDGASIDTSMGMTPTGGFLMGTRTGDLDPGVLIFLLRHGYEHANELERLCDRESGLLGLSAWTSDVRQLLARRKSDAKADLALRMFCYQVCKTVAAMAAALGGVEMLVFTGGIGEHAAELRDEITTSLAFLGTFEVCVLPTREDKQIARNTARLLLSSPR